MMFYERLRSLLKDKGMTGKEFSEEMGNSQGRKMADWCNRTKF